MKRTPLEEAYVTTVNELKELKTAHTALQKENATLKGVAPEKSGGMLSFLRRSKT